MPVVSASQLPYLATGYEWGDRQAVTGGRQGPSITSRDAAGQ